MEFRLPALGEGIESATVPAVLVKPGDAVKAGQNVTAAGTDKAAAEVRVDAAGMVAQVHVKPGDKIPAGGLILTLEAAGKAAEKPPEPAAQPKPTAEKKPAEERKPPEPAKAAPAAEGRKPSEPAPAASGGSRPPLAERPLQGNGDGATRTLIPAGPATRRLARELGVGLAEVKGSGRGGRVTLDDVKGFVRSERQRVREGGGAAAAPGGSIVNAFTLPPLPDFSKFGPVEVHDFAPIRQTIAKNLTVGWRTMPM